MVVKWDRNLAKVAGHHRALRGRHDLQPHDLLVLDDLEEHPADVEVLGRRDLDVGAGADHPVDLATVPVHQRARVDAVVLALLDGPVVQRQDLPEPETLRGLRGVDVVTRDHVVDVLVLTRHHGLVELGAGDGALTGGGGSIAV